MPTMTDIAKPAIAIAIAIGSATDNLAAKLTYYSDGLDLPVEAVIDMSGGVMP